MGQLVAVLAWPLLREAALARSHAAVALTAIVTGLFAAPNLTALGFIAAWFAIGLGSGTLMYLALASAALNADRQAAFALRLAFCLSAAGAVALVMGTAHAMGMPGTPTLALSIGFLSLGLVGLALYGAETMPPPSLKATPTNSATFGVALLVTALFFLGQVGHWSYSATLASDRGIALATTATTIGVCKLMAAALLLSPVGERLRTRATWRQWVPWVLVVSMIGMRASRNALELATALLVWEIALNTMSVQLLSLVSSINQRGAARWLGTAVLLGTATGPLTYGPLWAHMGPNVAAIASTMTVVVVTVWMAHHNRTTPNAKAALPHQARPQTFD